jgi:flagellar protein FlbT
MSSIRLSLRSGEKVYVNGAVMSVDRKVSLELLNDATFLLESHVLQAAQATTPLRQLYFVAQLMLMDPANAAQTRKTFDPMMAATLGALEDGALRTGLRRVRANIEQDRMFDALKELRALFPREDRLMHGAAGRAA